jgi:mycothiol synthase
MVPNAMKTTLATLTNERLDAVLALALQLDLGVRLDAAWLRRLTLDDPTCLSELLLVAEDGDAPVGLCFGALREGRGVVKVFGVAKGHRRRGIGTAMLSALEERLASLGATEMRVEGVAPNYLLPGVELTHTDAIAFLLGRGYETDRNGRVDMAVYLHRVDLDSREVTARLRAEGITLRRAEGDEIGATAAMARETFSATWEAEVSEAARFAPPPLFIAREGDRIVSFAAYDVTGPARFGPTGTDPAYRKRGIGGALLKECLRGLRDRGETIAEIGWAGPIAFYARAVNARIHRVYWGFRKPLDAGGHT